jgi:hypothetical protein
MIENLSIIYQLLILIIFFSFPINIYNFNILFKNINLSTIDCLSINIIINLNILLFISFLNFNIENVFNAIIILSIVFNLLYLKRIKKNNFQNLDQYIYKFFLSFIFLSICFEMASNPKLEWDGLAHWIEKASNFYQNFNIENLKNVGWAEYPHLGTYIWAIFWKASILEKEYFGRFFYAFFYILSIASFVELFFKDKKFLINKIILLIIFIVLSYDKFLFSGYQEYLIFSCLLIITKLTYLLINNQKNNLFLLFIIIIGLHLVFWFKDEGIIFFIIYSLTLIYTLKLNYIKKILLIIIIMLLIINQFYLQKYIIGYFGFQDTINSSDIAGLLQINILIKKIVLITQHILMGFAKHPLWIIIFTCIFFFINEILKKYRWLLIILILNFFLIFAIYLTTHHPLDWILKVSLDRILFEISSTYMLFLIPLIKKLEVNKKI